MSRTDLERAQSLLQRRKFARVISLLESGNNPEIYRESFYYYLMAGLACLYLGDTGSAGAYFQHARHIRMTDTTLLNAQAVLFLRRGDTDRAIQYYLDVLDYDPKNKTALSAMEFVRAHGTYEEICHLVDSGDIERFYPPLGLNPDVIKRIVFSVIAGVLLAVGILNLDKVSFIKKRVHVPSLKERADLSSLFLTVDEKNNLKEKSLSSQNARYVLADRQILKAYDDAISYFQDYRDNASQVEINRLLNSNASDFIKQNALVIQSSLKEQTFDSLLDNYDYSKVASDPVLYIGCYVAWSGRVSNSISDGVSYRCDLLVGYENMDRVDGFVPLFFEEAPYPEIDIERPVRVLAKISVENGKLLLDGKAVYQPLKRQM